MARSKKLSEDIIKRLGGTLTNKKDIWANDPVFLKRAQEMKEFIDKVGLPEELTKRKNRKIK